MTSSSRRPRRGWSLPDLAGLFGEIYEQSRSASPDQDKDETFDDRAVRLITTFQGAGVLSGDLTPECAEAVAAVLDALSAPAGAEDTRTQEQRYHDALPGSDAAPGRGEPASGAGRAAGQDLGAHLAGGPAPAGRQLGAAGRVDRAGPGPVGRAPRRRLRGRRGRRRLAGRRRRRGDRLRRGDGPDRDRRRQPGRPGDLVRLCVELDRLRRDGDDPADAGIPPGLGGDRAGRHRQGRRPAVRPRRAGELPAPPPARRPPGRAEPAAGHRVQPRPSRPGSATRSSCGTSTASGPGGATSPPRPARCTTPSTRPTAARPASRTACFCAGSTTRS